MSDQNHADERMCSHHPEAAHESDSRHQFGCQLAWIVASLLACIVIAWGFVTLLEQATGVTK